MSIEQRGRQGEQQKAALLGGDTLAGDSDALGKGKMTAAAQSLAMVLQREVRDLGSVPQPPWLYSWHWVSLLAGEVFHISAQPGAWHV